MDADGPSCPMENRVSDAEEVREILRSPVFVQAGGPVGTPFIYPDSLFHLDGAEHLARRRLEAPLFNEAAVGRYRADALLPAIARSLGELAATADEHGVVHVDLIPLLWRIIYRMAGRLIGLDGLDDAARTDQLVAIARDLSVAGVIEWSHPDAVEGITQRGLAAQEAYRRDYFEPSLAARRALVERFERGEVAEDELPRDLVTTMIRNPDPSWGPETPYHECINYLVGATASTVQSVPHFLFQLEDWFAAHPEHRQLVDSSPDFLRHAANESLRFFLSNPLRFRQATQDVTLSTGRQVAAGTVVGLMYRDANMDPRAFGEHHEDFDPFREAKGPGWGFAFGFGPHTCIGRPLVTGVGGADRAEGALATIVRTLYVGGLELDPDDPPVLDASTSKRIYEKVPIRLTKLDAAIGSVADGGQDGSDR